MVLDLWLKASNERFFQRQMRRGLGALRRYLAAHGDPLVRYSFQGRPIVIPTSHDLPYVMDRLPRFGENLNRLTGYVQKKYPDLCLIDIGANIGDTALGLRSHHSLPILCIEGNPDYFGLLQRNVAGLSDIVLEHTLVGASTGSFEVHLESDRGTARLVPNAAGAGSHSVNTLALNEILQRHPRFANAHLLKVDTDGWDLPILLGHLHTLRAQQPVLFFEYDPHWMSSPTEGLSGLERLREAGYAKALVYTNQGDYLYGMNLGDFAMVQEMDLWCQGWEGNRFVDLCLFAEKDIDLYDSSRRAEVAHTRKDRGFANSPWPV